MGVRALAMGLVHWLLTLNNHLYRPKPIFVRELQNYGVALAAAVMLLRPCYNANTKLKISPEANSCADICPLTASGSDRRSVVYQNEGNLLLLSLLLPHVGTVLDVGCGAGDNARVLRTDERET